MTPVTAPAAGRGLSSGWEGGYGTLGCLWTSPPQKGKEREGQHRPPSGGEADTGRGRGGQKFRGSPRRYGLCLGRDPPRPSLRALPAVLPGHLGSPSSGLPSRDAPGGGGAEKVRPPPPSILSPLEGAPRNPGHPGGAAPCLRSPHPGLQPRPSREAALPENSCFISSPLLRSHT